MWCCDVPLKMLHTYIYVTYIYSVKIEFKFTPRWLQKSINSNNIQIFDNNNKILVTDCEYTAYN